MTRNTRIQNRFTGYTAADCACEFCLYYGGKRKGCTIEICCYIEERQQAAERENKKKRRELL